VVSRATRDGERRGPALLGRGPRWPGFFAYRAFGISDRRVVHTPDTSRFAAFPLPAAAAREATAAAGRRRSGRRLPLICPPPREGRRFGPRDDAPAPRPSTVHPRDTRLVTRCSRLRPVRRVQRKPGAYPRAAAECWVDEACPGTSIHRPRLRLLSRLSRGRWRARGHC
jgi:hypothetical protein